MAVRYVVIFAKQYGTLVRYSLFMKVRYFGILFECAYQRLEVLYELNSSEPGKTDIHKFYFRIYLFVSDSIKVCNNTKKQNTQTNLSGTTQSINMRADSAKM